jgi:formylmethanofuran dehydrogenase subunit E
VALTGLIINRKEMKGFMAKSDWQKAVEFHGHACPGLAIGFKAVEAVKEKMGVTFSWDEELVCVTEN